MTLGPKYDITAADIDGHRRVTVTGEIDLASAGDLLNTLVVEPDRTVITDLSEVGFMDSTGMRALISANEILSENGGRLLLVYGDGPVERLIDLTGLGDRFEVFPTTEQAASAAVSS